MDLHDSVRLTPSFPCLTDESEAHRDVKMSVRAQERQDEDVSSDTLRLRVLNRGAPASSKG